MWVQEEGGGRTGEGRLQVSGLSNWVGGSAVTKTGNAGRGTDDMGGGEQTGFSWGPGKYVISRGNGPLVLGSQRWTFCLMDSNWN